MSDDGEETPRTSDDTGKGYESPVYEIPASETAHYDRMTEFLSSKANDPTPVSAEESNELQQLVETVKEDYAAVQSLMQKSLESHVTAEMMLDADGKPIVKKSDPSWGAGMPDFYYYRVSLDAECELKGSHMLIKPGEYYVALDDESAKKPISEALSVVPASLCNLVPPYKHDDGTPALGIVWSSYCELFDQETAELALYLAIQDAHVAGDSDALEALENRAALVELTKRNIATAYRLTFPAVTAMSIARQVGRPDNPPINHVQLMSRFTDALQMVPIDGVEHPVRVSPKGKPLVCSNVTLEYVGDDELVIKGLTHFDIEVNKAVGSMWDGGCRYATPAQIYRHMTGSKSGNIRPGTLNELCGSLMLQRSIDLTADCSDEVGDKTVFIEDENGNKVEVSPALLRERLLNVDPGIWTGGSGKPYLVFEFNKMPPTLKHDKAIGHVTTLPQKVFEDINAAVKQNEANRAIRDYLIYRIHRMAGGKSATAKIQYATIFENAGIGKPSRVQKSRYVDYVGKMLDVFVADGWHVTSWHEYSSKDDSRYRRKTGVAITIDTGKAKKPRRRTGAKVSKS